MMYFRCILSGIGKDKHSDSKSSFVARQDLNRFGVLQGSILAAESPNANAKYGNKARETAQWRLGTTVREGEHTNLS